MKFYQSTHPQVLAALKSFEEQIGQIRVKGRLLAAEVGGAAIAERSADGVRYRGIAFDTVQDLAIWNPRDANNAQTPRAEAAPDATSDQLRRHKALCRLFEDFAPPSFASSAGILEALGLPGDAADTAYFELQGTLYVSTPLTVRPDRATPIAEHEFSGTRQLRHVTDLLGGAVIGVRGATA